MPGGRTPEGGSPAKPPHSRKALETSWQYLISSANRPQPNPLTAERHWRLAKRRFPRSSRSKQPNPLTAERHWRLSAILALCTSTLASAKPPHSRKALETPPRKRWTSRGIGHSQTPSQPKGIGDFRLLFHAVKTTKFSQTPSQPKGIGDK